MKALAIVFTLFLVAMPVTAGTVDLPLPNLFDQLTSWFTAVWEAVGSLIASDSPDAMPSSAEEQDDPSGPPQEMGPVIVPIG